MSYNEIFQFNIGTYNGNPQPQDLPPNIKLEMLSFHNTSLWEQINYAVANFPSTTFKGLATLNVSTTDHEELPHDFFSRFTYKDFKSGSNLRIWGPTMISYAHRVMLQNWSNNQEEDFALKQLYIENYIYQLTCGLGFQTEIPDIIFIAIPISKKEGATAKIFQQYPSIQFIKTINPLASPSEIASHKEYTPRILTTELQTEQGHLIFGICPPKLNSRLKQNQRVLEETLIDLNNELTAVLKQVLSVQRNAFITEPNTAITEEERSIQKRIWTDMVNLIFGGFERLNIPNSNLINIQSK